MTGADRRAAELLADAQAAKILAEKDLTDCRDALARAEQALAEIEALADGWRDARPETPPLTNQSAVVGWATGKLYEDELRAVLCASQGGQ